MPVEKRKVERSTCALTAFYRVDGAERQECAIIDLTDDGAKISLGLDSRLPERFALLLPLFDDHWDERPVELRWIVGNQAGVRFVGHYGVNDPRRSPASTLA